MSIKEKNIILFLLLILCCQASYVKPTIPNINHDGRYVLSRIDNKGIHPLVVWEDPEWAYYFCNVEKENRTNRHLDFVKLGIVKYTCGKYYGDEL